MALKDRVIALAAEIGDDVKALNAAVLAAQNSANTAQSTADTANSTANSNSSDIGDMSTVPTTSKIVAGAIAELFGAIGNAGAQIDDSATDGDTTVTWSADKIYDTVQTAINTVKNDLTAGASAAYDTFAELQALMEADDTLAATMATQISQKVDFANAQTLTTAQKLQACDNIGVGDPETDFLLTYTTARDS